MLVNIDGYIRRVPEGTTFIEFHSGHKSAGSANFYDIEGALLEIEDLIALESNLPKLKWFEHEQVVGE